MPSRTQQKRGQKRVLHSAGRRRKAAAPLEFFSPKEAARYGERLARQLIPGEVVLLAGNLGSGKTVVVRGIARGLKIREPVTSPTFVLRKRYRLPRPIRGIRALNHIDAYRFSSAREVRGVLDELISRSTDEVWCIEWGGRIRSAVQSAKTRLIALEILSTHTRRCTESVLPA